MKLKCLIVDDEPVARNGMEVYVNEVDFLELVGKCEHPLRAAMYLNEQPVDLILLDIQMPKMSGITFLKTIPNPPLVIFTTAFSEFAVEAYSLDVIDYLMKPVSFDRFLKAVQKARDVHQLRNQAKQHSSTYRDFFFIKCDNKYERIACSEVLFVESLQNYVVINTIEKKFITYLTLSAVEEQLPGARFMKVHKSFMIALDKVKSIEGNDLLMKNGVRVPVSRNLRDEVMRRIIGDNLLKR